MPSQLNLSELISKAYLNETKAFTVSVSEDQIINHNKGLIMISSPTSSDISNLLLSNEFQDAKNKVLKWKKVFDDRYYMSVQRTGRSSDEILLNLVIDLGVDIEVPIVATNDVQFLNKTDYEAHEARICIAEGGLLDDARRVKNFSDEQYLKNSEDMTMLFEDCPKLIENVIYILNYFKKIIFQYFLLQME